MPHFDPNKPFSIENWNSLIRDVNDKLENPPSGCEPLEPLEEVEDPHRWSVTDIDDLRNKMIETCPDIQFNEELLLWRPEIITEIEDQIEDMWCDCCKNELCEWIPYASLDIDTVADGCLHYLFGNLRMDWAPVIHGMQVGEPGWKNRRWNVLLRNRYTGAYLSGSSTLDGRPIFPTSTSGLITCEGNIKADTIDTSDCRGVIAAEHLVLEVRLRCDDGIVDGQHENYVRECDTSCRE